MADFPCQDVSVAGQRRGLSGDRSGLWHEFHRVLSELWPRWTVIENVPGLLSSGAEPGADFGVVLRGLVDLGYGVAWRVLDARHFGVPQRRRRVFIVGCLGDAARAAAVLAVCESCGGHPQTRRETGEGVATEADGGVTGTLGGHHGNVRADQAWTSQLETRRVPAEQSGWQGHVRLRRRARGRPARTCQDATHEDDENLIVGSQIDEGAARPLVARASGYRMDMESETFVVANPLQARTGTTATQAVRGARRDTSIASSTQPGRLGGCHALLDQLRWRRPDNLIAQTVNSSYAKTTASAGSHGSGAPVNVVHGPMGVRRLTPLECERLQGWADDWTRYTADGKEIPDSHRYRMVGNGVVAPVAEWIGHRLVEADRWP